MMLNRIAQLIFYSFLLLFITLPVYSQNLVINGSFEEIDKKPKEPGEIMLAAPWTPGSVTPPDLYSESAKDDRMKVPNNAYGEEKAKDGENYAGIMMYSHGDKEPRSYLTQKLKYPMLSGEQYCVKFHVSFADLSKYAVNNLGCYISHDSIGSEDSPILPFRPQIINSTNRVFEKQWSWEPICRIYIADGGEQFITIGNFAPQDQVMSQSVRRPQGFTQTQLRDGYYYIDDISITPNATPENCKCEPGNFAFANLNKQEATFETSEKDIPKPVIIGTTGSIPSENKPAGPSHQDVIVALAQIGPIPVLACALAWLWWKEATAWFFVLLVWTVFVGTLDNFLRPILIKKGADLPLLLIFAGVIGGLFAFGLLGLFVGSRSRKIDGAARCLTPC